MQTIPGVREYMSPLEEEMPSKFLPKLQGLQSISGRLINILSPGAKISELGIPDPTEAAYDSHQMLQSCNERLV